MIIDVKSSYVGNALQGDDEGGYNRIVHDDDDDYECVMNE